MKAKPRRRKGRERAAKFVFFKKIFANLRALRVFAVWFCFCNCATTSSPQMAKVELKGAAEAELQVDGAPAGKMQGKTRLTLRPGHHVFEVRGADGTVQVREAVLGPGDFVSLDLGGKQ